MATFDYESAARAVLGRFNHVENPMLTTLGNCGGFSGARLWRVQCPVDSLCLKAWPPGYGVSKVRLAHSLMVQARQSGLRFVPKVWALHGGRDTVVSCAGHVWDLVQWMPGRADFHERPSRARLGAACQALAGLHRAWTTLSRQRGPCPAILRRVQEGGKWADRIAAEWQPNLEPSASQFMHDLVRRAWHAFFPRVKETQRLLEPWAQRQVLHQPCLCDIWHDHVLFEGEEVSGIIDYGSIKEDNVATDLARLLGSLVGDDQEMWSVGLKAYASLRPLSLEEEALISVLDKTGTLLGAGNWLKWLCEEKRQFDDPEAVARRLSSLVERIEGWK